MRIRRHLSSSSGGCSLPHLWCGSVAVSLGTPMSIERAHPRGGVSAPKTQMSEETIPMRAIVVTDEAAGTAGMTLVERPAPPAAINDVIVEIHASGFVPTEMAWPSTWTDRRDHDRTPSIPGHELAGVVTALGYGTTGLSVGQRVFGRAARPQSDDALGRSHGAHAELARSRASQVAAITRCPASAGTDLGSALRSDGYVHGCEQARGRPRSLARARPGLARGSLRPGVRPPARPRRSGWRRPPAVGVRDRAATA